MGKVLSKRTVDNCSAVKQGVLYQKEDHKLVAFVALRILHYEHLQNLRRNLSTTSLADSNSSSPCSESSYSCNSVGFHLEKLSGDTLRLDADDVCLLIDDHYVCDLEKIACSMIDDGHLEDFRAEFRRFHSDAFCRFFYTLGVSRYLEEHECDPTKILSISEKWISAYVIFEKITSQLESRLKELGLCQYRDVIIRCFKDVSEEEVGKLFHFVMSVMKMSDKLLTSYAGDPKFLLLMLKLYYVLYNSSIGNRQQVCLMLKGLADVTRKMLEVDCLDELIQKCVSEEAVCVQGGDKMSEPVLHFIGQIRSKRVYSEALQVINLSGEHSRFPWLHTNDHVHDLILELITRLVKKLELESDSLECPGYKWIFLINNLNSIVQFHAMDMTLGGLTVKYSCQRDELIQSYVDKVWGRVLSSLNSTNRLFPLKSLSPLELFTQAFDATWSVQKPIAVHDDIIVERLRDAISQKVITAYELKYSEFPKFRNERIYTPDALRARVQSLFE